MNDETKPEVQVTRDELAEYLEVQWDDVYGHPHELNNGVDYGSLANG